MAPFILFAFITNSDAERRILRRMKIAKTLRGAVSGLYPWVDMSKTAQCLEDTQWVGL